MIFKVGDTYTWSNTWYTGVPFGDHKIIIRVIHEDELAYTVEIVGRPFKVSGGYKITEDRLLGENVKPKSATFDHDLHIEALQADLDAAKEWIARLKAENVKLTARATELEALKTHVEKLITGNDSTHGLEFVSPRWRGALRKILVRIDGESSRWFRWWPCRSNEAEKEMNDNTKEYDIG